MIFQSQTPLPLDNLTTFVTVMIALSVATERVTETIKQWASPLLVRMGEVGATGTIQFLAVLSGMFVSALSGQNPINIHGVAPFDWKTPQGWLSCVLTGILASGGSATWNHLLDILKAAKVQKEATANALLPAPAKIVP